MAGESFGRRLIAGRLSRVEQAAVGSIAGAILGAGFLVLAAKTSPLDLPMNADRRFGMLLLVSITAATGLVVGLLAEVAPETETSASIAAPEVPAPPRLWIAGQIRARDGATREDLRALGRAVRAWWGEHPEVVEIWGLDRLLAGEYPVPSGPTMFVAGPPDPDRPGYFEFGWIQGPGFSCPAEVMVADPTHEDYAPDLAKAIPPDLVSRLDVVIDY